MSDEFEFVTEDGDPWWAMVKTPTGDVPVRVRSWTVTTEGVTAELAELRGADTSPENVGALKRMSRDEAWAQVAAWSKTGGSA
ncbi:hypothetical protein TUSST3_83650 [Streptomyces sp. TUS-ST3]|uniref:hypothetical protein n=1 Tax=Streptomyces sp. TUS-ST3 TaxID=3025591 RepID=UPI00235B457E|nr:hypothetical protein [Streptomyces sp. TUS-ST3]GLP71746.1 hypothetical protein TUSST3_83650 [Streptomyces sp. TUS-ST3]